MSFNSQFFNFFDAINDEVDNFNNFLGTRGYQPRRARLTDHQDESSNAVAKRGPQQSTISFPEETLFNDWFNDDYALTRIPFNRGPISVPVDILDHDENYELKVTVPGVKSQKDINLEYHKEANQILVTGEIPSAITEENRDKVKVNERTAGKFKRIISLPDYPGIDADNIKADYSSGILTLTVPKLKPKDENKNPIQKIAISSEESWGN